MEIIDCLVRISKLVLMCFQCIPSLKFLVEGFVKFRQILSLVSQITTMNSCCWQALTFVKQKIRRAVKHEHTSVGPHIADRTVCR